MPTHLLALLCSGSFDSRSQAWKNCVSHLRSCDSHFRVVGEPSCVWSTLTSDYVDHASNKQGNVADTSVQYSSKPLYSPYRRKLYATHRRSRRAALHATICWRDVRGTRVCLESRWCHVRPDTCPSFQGRWTTTEIFTSFIPLLL